LRNPRKNRELQIISIYLIGRRWIAHDARCQRFDKLSAAADVGLGEDKLAERDVVRRRQHGFLSHGDYLHDGRRKLSFDFRPVTKGAQPSDSHFTVNRSPPIWGEQTQRFHTRLVMDDGSDVGERAGDRL